MRDDLLECVYVSEVKFIVMSSASLSGDDFKIFRRSRLARNWAERQYFHPVKFMPILYIIASEKNREEPIASHMQIPKMHTYIMVVQPQVSEYNTSKLGVS